MLIWIRTGQCLKGTPILYITKSVSLNLLLKGWENYSKCYHLIQVFGFYTSFLLVFKWRLEHTMKKFNNSCFILAVWTGWVFSCSIIEFHPSKLQLNSNQQFYIDSTWSLHSTADCLYIPWFGGGVTESSVGTILTWCQC